MFILSLIYNSFDDGEESILNFLCSSQASYKKKIGCTCQTQPNGFRLIAEDAEVSFCFVEKKMLTYPLKWMAAVFLKEIVVIYHSSLRLKNQQLDQVGPTLKSIYHFRYYSNPSPRHAYLQGFLAVL